MATTAAYVGRVGGLAVALGVGAAVATGLAAGASAAPSDPAGSSARAEVGGAAARGEAPANRGPRAVRTAADKTRPAAAAAVAVGSAAGAVSSPAASVRAAATVRAAAPVPARAAAAVQRRSAIAPAVAPVATAPVTAAAASNPLSGIIDNIKQLLGCDPRGRRITIYLGTHFAIPNSFGFFIQKVSGAGTFTANSTYDLGDVDQYDWNKFTGIAFTPLEPDRNSVMVGWRYNLTSQEFEIAPFYNVDKARILPSANEVISVPVDQTFQYLVNYDGVTLTYGDKTVFKAFPEGLTPNVWTAARVSGWFGGNEVAPRTISYFIKID